MIAALYRQTGPAADVLEVEEVERPQPGPGEVLVRVRASGINPTDYKSRAGLTPRPIDGFQVPHMDGAGIIEGVGPGVNPGRVGERVWLFLAAAAGAGGPPPSGPWCQIAKPCRCPTAPRLTWAPPWGCRP